jgi:lysyl-tRNA synthetase class II
MEDHLRRVCPAFGRVFEIGKVFRSEVEDANRTKEFLLLEFAASDLGFAEGVQMLCEMVVKSVQSVYGSQFVHTLDFSSVHVRHFADVVEETAGIRLGSDGALHKISDLLSKHNIAVPVNAAEWELMELLSKHFVEPALTHPTVLVSFPASLQHVCALDPSSGNAQRLNLIVNGVEIADGGLKLMHADEYRAVYRENADFRRNLLGIADNELPEAFFDDAAAWGRPVFTVGVGIDRLFSLCEGVPIQEILPFWGE